jgi:hypothetical protein
MKPNPDFQNLPNFFWAAVRTLSQHCDYTQRKTPETPSKVKVPTLEEMRNAYFDLGLNPEALELPLGNGKLIRQSLADYFQFRADLINLEVEPNLMNAVQAKEEFEKLKRALKPKCPLPMNKQKGKKKAPAYLTCIVNMLIEANSGDSAVDYDPKELTTVTLQGAPLRTLARRVDGAFPKIVNPVAIWEVKEYYYTTTFGSRVADGVYETLLDGMELQELAQNEKVRILHYLMLDAKYTWWECGKSYLCRIIDMLHMGYVDEVLVGREVIQRLPELVKEWVQK